MSEHELKLDYLKQRPQTHLEKLRSDLERLERLVGSLRHLDADEASQIPALFDFIDDEIRQVSQSGLDLKGEQTQWETICLAFEDQFARFLRVVGGREALRALREANRADNENWWWHPDRHLDEQRRSHGARILIWLVIAAACVGGLAFLYQRYLAPDQATQTSLRYDFSAENLADQGDYQAAYDQIELAIEAKPGQADQYTLKGILAELLGKSAEAAQAYQQAEANSPDRATFLLDRANGYLRYGKTAQAIVDVQAAIALAPDQPSAYLILGQAYESSGDYQKALDNYRTADGLATEQNDAQVQVIARMSIGQLYNKLPVLAPTEAATPTP